MFCKFYLPSIKSCEYLSALLYDKKFEVKDTLVNNDLLTVYFLNLRLFLIQTLFLCPSIVSEVRNFQYIKSAVALCQSKILENILAPLPCTCPDGPASLRPPSLHVKRVVTFIDIQAMLSIRAL